MRRGSRADDVSTRVSGLSGRIGGMSHPDEDALDWLNESSSEEEKPKPIQRPKPQKPSAPTGKTISSRPPLSTPARRDAAPVPPPMQGRGAAKEEPSDDVLAWLSGGQPSGDTIVSPSGNKGRGAAPPEPR